MVNTEGWPLNTLYDTCIQASGQYMAKYNVFRNTLPPATALVGISPYMSHPTPSLVAPQSECHANQSHLAMSRVTSREVRVFSKDTQGEGPFTKPSSLINANFDLFE